jgi:hypothetical protein
MDPCLAGRQASFRLGSEFRMTEKDKVKKLFLNKISASFSPLGGETSRRDKGVREFQTPSVLRTSPPWKEGEEFPLRGKGMLG